MTRTDAIKISLEAVRGTPVPLTERPSRRLLPGRVWMGARLSTWIALLRGHRFAFGWRRLPLVLWITMHCAFVSTLARVQRAVYRRRIESTELHDEPIFVLGHWGSGTTYLHELLALDPAHVAPTTWECFVPDVSVLFGEWFPSLFLRLLMPTRRPGDGARIGWRLPQEDEFALCNLGLLSPYSAIAFPGDRSFADHFRSVIELSDTQQSEWQTAFLRFLKQVSLRRPGRLVLKSPPHTCRVGLLLRMFPRARFIHVVRDPRDIFRSTDRMWRSLFADQCVPSPRPIDPTDDILEIFNFMHRRLDDAADRIPAENMCVVRYEHLIDNPLDTLADIYSRFQLPNLQAARERIRQHVAVSTFRRRTTHRPLSPADTAGIEQHWGWYYRRYGYKPDSHATSSKSGHAPARFAAIAS